MRSCSVEGVRSNFIHPFERNSVYAEIPLGTSGRRPRARRARVGGAGGDVTEIARHLLETEPGHDEWTTSVLVEAARRASRVRRPRAGRTAAGTRRSARRLRPRGAPRSPSCVRRSMVSSVAIPPSDTSVARPASGWTPSAWPRLRSISWTGCGTPLRRSNFSKSPNARASNSAPSSRNWAIVFTWPRPCCSHPLPRIRVPDNRPTTATPTSPHRPTGRLLAAAEALRSAARLNSTSDQLIAALRASLTPERPARRWIRPYGDRRGCPERTRQSRRVRDRQIQLLGSAMTAAESTGRRLDANSYRLVLAESMADARSHPCRRATARRRRIRGRRCPQSLGRHSASVVCRTPRAPRSRSRRPADDPERHRSRARRTGCFVGDVRHRDDRRGCSSSTATLQALSPTSTGSSQAAEQFAVRNPVFAPWRAGRSAALAGLGRSKEGAALAAENLRTGTTVRFSDHHRRGVGVRCPIRAASAQVVLLSEAIDADRRTPRPNCFAATF